MSTSFSDFNAGSEEMTVENGLAPRAYDQSSRFHHLLLLVDLGVSLILYSAFILYQKLHRSESFRHGSSYSASRIILPSFQPLLYTHAVIVAVFIIMLLLLFTVPWLFLSVHAANLGSELFYNMHQFLLLTPLVLLLQKSVSKAIIRTTCLLTLPISIYTIVIMWYVHSHAIASWYTIVLLFRLPPVLFVIALVFCFPKRRANKNAAREYCIYATLYYLLQYLHNVFHFYRMKTPADVFVICTIAISATSPIALWRLLRADTESWRKLAQNLPMIHRKHSNFYSPNASGIYKRFPSRASTTIDHTLLGIELHSEHIIDFAYLHVKEGSNDTTLTGILRKHGGAVEVSMEVKTLSTRTEEAIAEQLQEAALASSLRHPNIVTFFGVTISPPYLYTISELCSYTLKDSLRAFVARRDQQCSLSGSRPQLLLNLAQLIDATRAVAYLHSFSLVHGDLRPTNFVFDDTYSLKLTGFSHCHPSMSSNASRASVELSDVGKLEGRIGRNPSFSVHDMPHYTYQSKDGNEQNRRTSFHNISHVSYPNDRESECLGQYTLSVNEPAASTSNLKSSFNCIRTLQKPAAEVPVTHPNESLAYTAPELLQSIGTPGSSQTKESSDIYALGMALYDILFPGCIKYPDSITYTPHVFTESVVDGVRPALDANGLHPCFYNILQSMWAKEPHARPTASTVVKMLEAVQVELAAEFALFITEDLEDTQLVVDHSSENPVHLSTLSDKKSSCLELRTAISISGAALIDKWKFTGTIESVGEGIRLGNALMDAGMLHHAAHADNFDYLIDENYFFDEDNVALAQPMLEMEKVAADEAVRYYYSGQKVQRGSLDYHCSKEYSPSSSPSNYAPSPMLTFSHHSFSTSLSNSRSWKKMSRDITDFNVKRTTVRSVSEKRACLCVKLGQRFRLDAEERKRCLDVAIADAKEQALYMDIEDEGESDARSSQASMHFYSVKTPM